MNGLMDYKDYNSGGLTFYKSHSWIMGVDGNYYCTNCGLAYTLPYSGMPCPGYQSLQQPIDFIIYESEIKMHTKEQIAKNKFHVSPGDSITKGEGFTTIEEAIESAKGRLSANKDIIEQVIYQVVKVVRKELPPVTVVDVE